MCSDFPFPTQRQCEQFARQVCSAHSWYKHLSLFDGAEFVFFFSEESGLGYSQASPRLHYGWKTTEDYRDYFGYLDYMYRLPGDLTFRRDGRAKPALVSEEILSLCGVVVYPFISNDSNAPEVLAWIVGEECLEELNTASSWSKQSEILRWYQTYQSQDEKWQQLSHSEQAIASSMYLGWEETEPTTNAEELTNVPRSVADYLRCQIEALNLYRSLQQGEQKKVNAALTQLRSRSEKGGQVWF